MKSVLPRRLGATAALALAALLSIAPLNVQAARMTVNFDELAGTDYMPGGVVAAPYRLRDQYLESHGVRFSSAGGFAALVNLGVGHAHSGSIGIASTLSDGRLWYTEPITLEFFALGSSEAGVTDYVSLFTDRHGDGRTVTLSAYGLDGALLEQRSWVDTGGIELSLTVDGIHKLVFSGGASTALDSLSFNDPVRPGIGNAVPEPGSLALMAGGLLAVALQRRQRKA